MVTTNGYIILHWVDHKEKKICLYKTNCFKGKILYPFNYTMPIKSLDSDIIRIDFPSTDKFTANLFTTGICGKMIEQFISESDTFQIALEVTHISSPLEWLNTIYEANTASIDYNMTMVTYYSALLEQQLDTHDIKINSKDNKMTTDSNTCSTETIATETVILSPMAQIVKELGGRYNYGFIIKHPVLQQHGIVINFHQQHNKLKYSVLRIDKSSTELSQTSWVLDNIEIVTPINLNSNDYGMEIDRDYTYKLLSQYNKSL